MEAAHEEIFGTEVISNHIQNSEWNLDVPVKQWCAEACFYDLRELILELYKSKLASNPPLPF